MIRLILKFILSLVIKNYVCHKTVEKLLKTHLYLILFDTLPEEKHELKIKDFHHLILMLLT